MRRRIKECGGYFSRRSNAWVFPARNHNCGAYIEAQTGLTLAEAYEAHFDYEARVRANQAFGEAEAAFLRSMR